MRDATSQLRFATKRGKSDVANKLISMFLHSLSLRISESWRIRVDSEEYEDLVRKSFGNRCPYCFRALVFSEAVVEHLDGMNRRRAGLHVPGNVLMACKKCNSEKRRDDTLAVLVLAPFGWASFLSHDGSTCASSCRTCSYWSEVWVNESERRQQLTDNLSRIRSFRSNFPELEQVLPRLQKTLPALLTKVYVDCQEFAETEMKALLEKFEQLSIREQ